jgi:hypothetical protein
MRIWRLSPTNPADPIWKLWQPEPVFVRAQSEAEVRRLAAMATIEFQPPQLVIPINPWSGHKKIEDAGLPTHCEDMTGQIEEFSAEGPAEVLRHGQRS